jgi:hypothetical protein
VKPSNLLRRIAAILAIRIPSNLALDMPGCDRARSISYDI